MMRIGIDVGGTNTDAALLDDERVVATVKTPTTEDVTSGVREALRRILEAGGPAALTARAVMVGTTHFVNAVVERRDLERVAVLRLCLPASASVLPFADWPADLRDLVRSEVVLLPGGHEIDGREIAPFDEAATREAARRVADAGIRSVAISAVFSALRPDHEERAAEIVRDLVPGARITLSKDLGRIGLLERENVTIVNGALGELAARTTAAFRTAIAESGIDARLYLTQNDGTVMSAETAERYPVLCFASGPTNSMRGAAFLSGLRDAAVVDVGGTTSDIGILANGFPREANTVVEVGGVRTLFRMPDVVSLPLGGGTRVRTAPFRLGPDSLGFRLTERGRVFGGPDLCATDVAVARGLVALGDAARVGDLDESLAARVVAEAARLLEDGVDRMKTQAGDIPLIAVGGGSFLVPPALAGVSDVVVVPHHDVANAIGAAIAQVSGEVDQVLVDMSREEAIDHATALAHRRAEAAGATPGTLEVVDVEEIPLAYMPGSSRRVRVRVAGRLA